MSNENNLNVKKLNYYYVVRIGLVPYEERLVSYEFGGKSPVGRFVSSYLLRLVASTSPLTSLWSLQASVSMLRFLLIENLKIILLLKKIVFKLHQKSYY